MGDGERGVPPGLVAPTTRGRLGGDAPVLLAPIVSLKLVQFRVAAMIGRREWLRARVREGAWGGVRGGTTFSAPLDTGRDPDRGLRGVEVRVAEDAGLTDPLPHTESKAINAESIAGGYFFCGPHSLVQSKGVATSKIAAMHYGTWGVQVGEVGR